MDRTDVGENEPHALVDRRLTPGERCKVEPHLATRPTVAERVRDLLVQRAVLAALGEASGAAGPGPTSCRPTEAPTRAVRRRRLVRRAGAAAAAVLPVAIGRGVS